MIGFMSTEHFFLFFGRGGGWDVGRGKRMEDRIIKVVAVFKPLTHSK